MERHCGLQAVAGGAVSGSGDGVFVDVNPDKAWRRSGCVVCDFRTTHGRQGKRQSPTATEQIPHNPAVECGVSLWPGRHAATSGSGLHCHGEQVGRLGEVGLAE